MNLPFGIDLGVLIGTGVVIAIALIGFMVKTWWTLWNLTTNLAAWKGGLDQWKKGIDDWRNSVDKRFDKFEENTIMLRDGETITKTTLWNLGRTNDMIQRHSPLVPSKQAIEILEELNIIPEVNANTSYIQEEIEKRAQTSLYRDIEDQEERFIEIAPGVIHSFIKKGKIDEKKIYEAMKELENVFSVVTYYGVLLLIAAYISEKGWSRASKLSIAELERQKILRNWNRLMAGVTDYSSARKILGSIQAAGLVPDIFTYNTLIKKAPDYAEAKALVDTMRGEGIQPNVITYSALVDKAPDYDEAKALVESMRGEGIQPNVITYSALVDKAPDYDEAKALVETMRGEGILPNVVTYSELVDKAPDYDEAMVLVATMREEGVPPNVFTYSTLVKKAPDYDKAKALVDTMRREGIQPNVVTYSELVDKAPDYDEAKALLETMRKEGTPPNVYTYNTLIKKAPDYDEAKALLETMRGEGIQLGIVTYNTLVDKALDYNEATAWVYTMREGGIPPDIYTYNTLIKKVSDYQEAKALVDTMREEGIPPDDVTYNTLIKKAPNYAEAKALVAKMREEGIKPNVYTYNSLFKKDLSRTLADDILKWYFAQKYHPELPIQAAIATYRKTHRLDQALRLALDYPHLQAARKLIREHETEALAYFRTISDHDPQHPNAEYALGVALMELEQELEAEQHLKNALKLATAGPRKTVIMKWLRQIADKRSHKR